MEFLKILGDELLGFLGISGLIDIFKSGEVGQAFLKLESPMTSITTF
jgi:hypothetical protein